MKHSHTIRATSRLRSAYSTAECVWTRSLKNPSCASSHAAIHFAGIASAGTSSRRWNRAVSQFCARHVPPSLETTRNPGVGVVVVPVWASLTVDGGFLCRRDYARAGARHWHRGGTIRYLGRDGDVKVPHSPAVHQVSSAWANQSTQ